MPKVSVIIPTYNRERFITETIDSVLAQTYRDFEVIVVDDGSTDNTQAVLAQYADRITTIYQENKRQPAARNTGLRAAHGEYILLLDSDDLIPPEKLAVQVAFLDTHLEFGLVYSGWQNINEDGTCILGEMRMNKQGYVLKDLLRRQLYFTPGAALVRRDCFAQVGGFDESLSCGDDTDMWLRIARNGCAFGYIDQLLLIHRIHEDGVYAKSLTPGQVRDRFTSIDKIFADPELPEDVKAIQAEVYGYLHYETAARYYSAKDVKIGQKHLREAVIICPALASNKTWLLEWIAGFTLGPRVENPHHLIDWIFDNLPQEATTLHSLRRQAHGAYHIAAAFAAYQNQRIKDIRKHILPALLCNPYIIRNRGFISISIQSLLA